MSEILSVLPLECPWCGAPVPDEPGATQCPACGAALTQPQAKSVSGWTQLPPIPDMTELRFGYSSCQIAGDYVPMADVALGGSDSVYFAHHVLLWKDDGVEISVMPLAGGWKRLFAGLPVVMTQAHGSGHIAFSHDAAGEIVALPLQPGQSVDVREHLFLLASQAVQYSWLNTNVWFVTSAGNDEEVHLPVGQYMDRFQAAESPGLLLLHAPGNIFVRRLQAGQTLLIKPTALLFKDPSVQMILHFETPSQQSGFITVSHRTVWLSLTGPGRVAIHSAYSHMEDCGAPICRTSTCTAKDW